MGRATITHTADSAFCARKNLTVLATVTGFTLLISNSFAVDLVKATNLQFIGAILPTALYLAGFELTI